MQVPSLYLVSTPIGHLEDITWRAVRVLKEVDKILCENPQHSGILLKHYGIETPTYRYHEHTSSPEYRKITGWLESGQTLALISDAGTPLLSDPGYPLIQFCHTKGLKVTAIPGPSSLITAVTLSGLPLETWTFLGFLPRTSAHRRALFKTWQKAESTLFCFESPFRLVNSLKEALALLGDRRACVLRELTKAHEEIRPGSLLDLFEYYQANPPKGEIILGIQGALSETLDHASILSLVANQKDTLPSSMSEALTHLHQDPRLERVSKRTLYEALLKVRKTTCFE